jgi:hypothetical protein
MYRAFGFSFTKLWGLVLFLVLLVAFVLVYHRLIESSIRNHPESTLHAVQNHCRYVLGKQLDKMPKDEFSAQFRLCNDIRIKSVEAAGGVFDPVIVKITIEDQRVFIFKSADIGPRSFNFLSSLSSLMSGHWAFNFYTTYSETTFHGSF